MVKINDLYVVRRKITVRGLLEFLGAEMDVFFPLTKKQLWRNIYNPKYISWEDYFPSEAERVIKRMQRKGIVNVETTDGGMRVKITNKGRQEILQFQMKKRK